MYVKIVLVWTFSVLFRLSSAVIYSLNDTEYALLPPLWSMEPYADCMAANGTYCVLTLHLTAAPGNKLMHTIQEYSEHYIKHYNHSVVDRGVCVSTSCAEYLGDAQSAEELRAAAEACSRGWARAWGLRARVLGARCTRGARRQPRAGDRAALAALLALAALNCAAFAYHIYCQKYNRGNQNTYLLYFSVLQNWRRLTNMEMHNEKSRELRFIHGPRMITCLCTTLLHVVSVYAGGFTQNPHDMEKSYEQTSYQLFYCGLIFIQIFFFTSGFLKSYDIQMDKEKRQVTVRDFPRMLLLRLSRLFPALAVTLALVTSWLRHAGSGPLWEQFVTSSLVADCRSYWWHHLLFINNYTQQGKYCLLPTWHLAADMQVFMLAVLTYLASRRLLLVLLLLGVLAPGVHTLLQDLDVVMITPEFFRRLDNRTLWIIHVLGHNNLTTFILGMLTAEWVYAWKARGGHLVPKWQFSMIQYVSVAAMPLLIISGQGFYADAARAGVLTRAAYNSAARLLFGLLCAASTVGLFSNTPTYMKRLMQWRGWVVPSRLTYGVMLLHIALVHATAGAREQLSLFTGHNVIKSYIFIVVASFLAAVPLYLFVEAPFTALFKQLLKKRPQVQADTSTACNNGKLMEKKAENGCVKEKTS